MTPAPGEVPAPEHSRAPVGVPEAVRDLLAASAEPTRLRGVHALRDGPCTPGSLALLVETLADGGRYVPHAARAALVTLGTSALPALFAAAADPRPAVRAAVGWVLATTAAPLCGGGGGEHDAAAVLELLAADPDRDVRLAAAAVHGRANAGIADERRLSALATLVGVTEPRVREQAAHSLASFGAAGDAPREGAVALLLDALDDPVAGVRGAAAASLRRYRPPAGGVVRVRQARDEEVSPAARGALDVLVEAWERARA